MLGRDGRLSGGGREKETRAFTMKEVSYVVLAAILRSIRTRRTKHLEGLEAWYADSLLPMVVMQI